MITSRNGDFKSLSAIIAKADLIQLIFISGGFDIMYMTFLKMDNEYRYSYVTEDAATVVVVVRNLHEKFNIFLPVDKQDLEAIKERIGACGYFAIEKATIIGHGKELKEVNKETLDKINLIAKIILQASTKKLNHIYDLIFDIGRGFLSVDETNEILSEFSLTGNEVRIMNNRYRFMTVSEFHNGKVINPFDEINSENHYTLKVVMIGTRKSVIPVKDNRKEFFKIS